MWFLYILTIFISTVSCWKNSAEPKVLVETAMPNITYAVSIRVHNVHICTGTVIGVNYILTAAYCCYDPKTFCLINHEDYNIVSSDRMDNPCRTKVTKVLEVTVHENFSYLRHENNIAVLKLKTQFLESMIIKRHSSKDYTASTKIPIYYGWSFNETVGDQLQMVRIMLLPIKECIKALGRPMVGEVCTAQGVCEGDIGGPLICGTVLCGINMFKICSNKTYRGFVNVYYHTLWLDKIQKDDAKKSSCCRNRRGLVILCFVLFTAKYISHIM